MHNAPICADAAHNKHQQRNLEDMRDLPIQVYLSFCSFIYSKGWCMYITMIQSVPPHLRNMKPFAWYQFQGCIQRTFSEEKQILKKRPWLGTRPFFLLMDIAEMDFQVRLIDLTMETSHHIRARYVFARSHLATLRSSSILCKKLHFPPF